MNALEEKMKQKRIPIKVAKEIAQNYNYDQVIIIARNIENDTDWVTTYGKTKELCKQTAAWSEWIYSEMKYLARGDTIV